MKKLNIMTSIAIVASFSLVGCGGGSSAPAASALSTSTALTAVTGTAIDPELMQATVCLDIDGDTKCTSVDPSTITDDNGNYILELTQSQIEGGYPLLVVGGIDKATGEAFKGKLLAELNGTTQNITPLTTLVVTQILNAADKATAYTSRQQLETFLGLSYEEIESNFITLANEGDTKPLQVALTLQKSAEALTPENTLDFYTAVIQKLETSNPSQTLSDIIVELTPDNLKTDMISFIEETMTTSLGNAYAMAEQTQEEAVARGLDFASRMIDMQTGTNIQTIYNDTNQSNNGQNYTDEGNRTIQPEETPENPGQGLEGMEQPGTPSMPENPLNPTNPTAPQNPQNPIGL